MFPAERVSEMKIGVITFHRAINYGAALQTYALQRAISDLGFDTEVIDYRCEHMENLYKLIGGHLSRISEGLLILFHLGRR